MMTDVSDHACKFGPQKWVKLSQNRKIWNFFRLDFSVEPKCTEI